MSVEDGSDGAPHVERPPMEGDATVKVLVDDPDTRERYVGWLEDRYQVSGDEIGIDVVVDRADRPCVVLLGRPDADPADVVTELRGDGFSGAVGFVLPRDSDGTLEGMQDTAAVTPPVTRADVRELVDRLVRRRRYRALLEQDYAVTVELTERTVGDGTSVDAGGLAERKRGLQSSLRSIVEKFDDVDYTAIFREGFTDYSSS